MRGALRRAVAPLGLVVALLTGSGLPLALPAHAEWQGEGVLIGPARSDALHVMSFNLRYASAAPPNSWAQRRPVLAELLRDEQPTVLGTQEGLYGQLQDIEQDLPGYYDWIGLGRAGGSHDEFMALFYDAHRLTPLEFNHFWLSDTPNLMGSNTWGNASVRMVTTVRFADNLTGAEFVVVNTHLDDQSEYSRVRSAELLRDRINAITPALPVVVTGDFNAPAQSSAPYDILTGAGLSDAWLAAADRRTPAYATWHGYQPPVVGGPRIDWILTRGPVTVAAAAINPFARDGQLPSDHFPMQALLAVG
ncbi:endonuclease/exonuclease/phosphatase family protein [Actinophytocola sp.]|uniref:endonuclease/exonuclease/phosphatase family protein n=1 Tax=Actinophytocola sp. TaxID=1872138 RepID=UPI002D7F1B28|nr:endonuclease/exonuclease/phosphatase family protein [Actinophytocola sp.]HET9139753.1 endonuclease/exonuclease/phosphatase family protein [Actinophytocola sp.]